MKRRHISAAIFGGGFLIAYLCFPSCQCYSASLPAEQELDLANTSFAFNLLQQIGAEQPGTNIFISPYSASTVLQMVSTGAAGTTLTEMREALCTTSLTTPALCIANKEIHGIINNKNTNFLLSTANAVWYKTGIAIEPSFTEDNERFFGARVSPVDFSNPATVDTINAWASDETRGKITQVATYPMDPAIRLFLANAVYFLGTWQNPFDTNDTTNQPFFLNGGGQETVPMMSQNATFNYCEGNGYQAVQLPYKGGDLSMYVFLPGPGTNLADFVGAMNAESWQEVIQSNFTAQQGTVSLPRFNLNFQASLVPALKALGMKTAFTDDADFSKITTGERLLISAVQQQAVVEVNELGTEAAAVTTVTIVGAAVPGNTFQMTVNRPFLFVIEDQQAGAILFMGTVFQP
jgi:serpin B